MILRRNTKKQASQGALELYDHAWVCRGGMCEESGYARCNTNAARSS